MTHKRQMLQCMIIACSAISLQCTSPEEPDVNAYFYTLKTPLVTGVHITTLDMPDGTGETIGVPSYSIPSNGPNIFPNPYAEPDTLHRFEDYQFYVVFSHMPAKATVVIVKGRTPEEIIPPATSYLGTTIPSRRTNIVRTIVKDDPFQFLRWDLTDQEGAPIPSGVYRAFYYGPSIDGFKFMDLFVKRGRKLLINF
jgi:hypothetical protein